MSNQFPDLPGGADAATFTRASLPDWPRLMNERQAAAYLSIGTTSLRKHAPKPKKVGGRSLWDRRDLDRFADGAGGVQALDDGDVQAQAKDVERAWLEGRKRRKGQGDG